MPQEQPEIWQKDKKKKNNNNNNCPGSSCCGSAEKNLTGKYENEGLTPGLAQWVKVPALP